MKNTIFQIKKAHKVKNDNRHLTFLLTDQRKNKKTNKIFLKKKQSFKKV
jgi:hypothetical protein